MILVWLVGGLSFAAHLVSGEDSLAAAIEGLQNRYRAVDSISAHFQQTYRAPGIEQIESGVLWMKKPGLMRWDYQSPTVKLFIADGKETFLYTPEDRQVLVTRFSAAELHSTPLQFLLGQGDIRKSYSVAWESESRPKLQGTLLLRLVPRAEDPEYSYLVLEIDARTFDIRRIVIHERTGNTSEFVLTDVATNVRVNPKQFQFKAPKGVEIVRLDER